MAARIFLTILILAFATYAVVMVWTRNVDVGKWIGNKLSNVIPVSEFPIIVTPQRFDLVSGEWNGVSLIEVKNTESTKAFYSIWVKIWSEGDTSILDSIEVLPEKDKWFVSAQTKKSEMSFEIIQFGAIDGAGHPCICLLIYRMEGLESIVMKVSRVHPGNKDHETTRLFAKVTSTSESPAQVLSQGEGGAVGFTPPENLNIKWQRILVRGRTAD